MMNARLPMVSFDTGAHNRLADEGARSHKILASLKSKYFFRLLGLSFEELMSTPEAGRRSAFIKDCRNLQTGEWDCLHPVYEVLKQLISAHSSDQSRFQWLDVDVRSGEINHEIHAGELTADDALSTKQREEQKESLKAYKQQWVGLRAKLETAFVAQAQERPTTFKAAYEEYGPTLLPGFGKGLYDAGLRAAAADRGEQVQVDTGTDTVKHFIDNCPPFSTLLAGLMMSWYHHSARDEKTGERFRAGRNDLFMSLYLPYCDIFVTAEQNGEQERCLKEIATIISSKTEIVSYDSFVSRL